MAILRSDGLSGLQLGDVMGILGLDVVGILGLIASVASLVLAYIGLYRQVRRSALRLALREFWSMLWRPWHVVMSVIVLGSTVYLIVMPTDSFPASLVIMVPVLGMFALLVSFFLAQSKHVSSAAIVNEMAGLAKVGRDRFDGVASAVRFDVDRLKAITNYSPSLGERIQETVNRVVHDEASKLRDRGLEVIEFEIPGEDEVVVAGAGLSVEEAAAFADRVRVRVKQDVNDIPGYDDSVDLIMKGMRPAPSRNDEREGIGTVSAGVAGDRGGAETWFSDMSAAVKESKTHGRNKTVIYRPGRTSEIRGDSKMG